MPTPRALLLIICPLLLLFLAGPLAAAQPPLGLEAEPSRQAADQEALSATVAEQGRELDRLSGKVDGLQSSLDSAAKSGEAASRTGQLVVGLLGIAGGLAAAFIALLAFLGYRHSGQVARRLTADIEAIGDEAKRRLEEARQCEESVRESAERFEALMKRLEHSRDALQTEARKYQDATDMSEEQKKALDEWASRLDSLEVFGLPLDPESYLARGNAYYAKGDYERALQCYDRALDLRPDYAEAHVTRGATLGNVGRHDEALAAFDRSIRLNPDFAEAHAYRTTALGALRRYEEVITACEVAIKLNPDSVLAWNNWGTALLYQARTKDVADADSLFQQAYEKYARAVKIEPDFHEAWNNWGAALLDQAKTKKDADADSLFQQAYEKYARAVQIKPEYHQAWYNWGTALLDQARTKQDEGADTLFQHAEEKYARAVEIKPDYVEAHFNRACTRSLQGNVAEALADLSKAITLDSKCREKAKTDPDFEPLRSDPGFRKLVGLDPNKPEQDQP